jgi:hypothetical protein
MSPKPMPAATRALLTYLRDARSSAAYQRRAWRTLRDAEGKPIGAAAHFAGVEHVILRTAPQC